jgi:DUF2934 family protein
MNENREGRAMPKSQPQNLAPAHDEIAHRAYRRYLERGSTDGYDMEDWLAAEQELARERQEAQPPRQQRSSKPEAA